MSRIRRYRWLIGIALVVSLALIAHQMHLADGIWAAIKAMHGG